ncbi:MAG: type II toxin-antitoxin system mRNA interferase toxin, RelE/StbE family [Magnetococcales bacterium]|nr:type II toxin-antitoxin system mRNA interferase toxin, RelE/StbE family [Nitrospirota bacterium]
MKKIILSDRAKAELRSLDPPIIKRILNKLKPMVDEIDNMKIKSLNGNLKGYYRVRLNDDYRAIFFVEGEEVIVMSIGHREGIVIVYKEKDIYR